MAITFMKLDINILNDSKIKVIRKMPDGDKLVVLWLGLLCLGMRSTNPGVLEIGYGIPFNESMLSAELDIPENVIKYGLNIFNKMKMIEDLNGFLYITNFEKHQNMESINRVRELGRKRQAKHRKKHRNALLTHESPNSNATDLDLDLDKTKTEDIDKDIYIQNKKIIPEYKSEYKDEEPSFIKDAESINNKIQLFKKIWAECFPDNDTISDVDFPNLLAQGDRLRNLQMCSLEKIEQSIRNFSECAKSDDYSTNYLKSHYFIERHLDKYDDDSNPWGVYLKSNFSNKKSVGKVKERDIYLDLEEV